MKRIINLLTLLIGTCFSQIILFQGPQNEAFFSVEHTGKKLCISGRIYRDGYYHALLGIGDSFYYLGEESYSYTVETFKGECLFGTVIIDQKGFDIQLLWKEKNWKAVRLRGDSRDMLWFIKRVKDGYILTGGVRKEDWDILVIKLSKELKPLWSFKLGNRSEEYAYGVASLKGRLYLVGRTNYRDNWDAFLIILNAETGEVIVSKLIGTDKKDYLRFIDIIDGGIAAVGRTEFKNREDTYPTMRDSELLLLKFSPEGRLLDYRVWGGEGYDYGRVLIKSDESIFLLGESSSKSVGETDGLIAELSRNWFLKKICLWGGEGIESIRHAIPFNNTFLFVGYTYSFSMDNDALLGMGMPCRKAKSSFRRYYPYLEVSTFPITRSPYPIKLISPHVIPKSFELQVKYLPISQKSRKNLGICENPPFLMSSKRYIPIR